MRRPCEHLWFWFCLHQLDRNIGARINQAHPLCCYIDKVSQRNDLKERSSRNPSMNELPTNKRVVVLFLFIFSFTNFLVLIKFRQKGINLRDLTKNQIRTFFFLQSHLFFLICFNPTAYIKLAVTTRI